MAKIISVNISNNKGEKKHNIGRCHVLRHTGLENDAHGEDKTRQISLLAAESIEKIRQKGLPVNYGDFAENLTTQGLILHTLPLGTKLKIGSEVVLEVTQIGKSCLKPCAIYFTVGDCVMPKEGIFARVLTEGVIATGDEIKILSQTTSS